MWFQDKIKEASQNTKSVFFPPPVKNRAAGGKFCAKIDRRKAPIWAPGKVSYGKGIISDKILKKQVAGGKKLVEKSTKIGAEILVIAMFLDSYVFRPAITCVVTEMSCKN